MTRASDTDRQSCFGLAVLNVRLVLGWGFTILQILFQSGQLQLRLVGIETNETEYLIDLKTYFEHCSRDQFAYNLYGKFMEN